MQGNELNGVFTCAPIDWFKNVGHGTALESWYLGSLCHLSSIS